MLLLQAAAKSSTIQQPLVHQCAGMFIFRLTVLIILSLCKAEEGGNAVAS